MNLSILTISLIINKTYIGMIHLKCTDFTEIPNLMKHPHF